MDLAHHHGPISRLKSKLVWLGIALTILGILAIATPWAAATFVDFMVAGSLLAAGITQLGAAASTFTNREPRGGARDQPRKHALPTRHRVAPAGRRTKAQL